MQPLQQPAQPLAYACPPADSLFRVQGFTPRPWLRPPTLYETKRSPWRAVRLMSRRTLGVLHTNQLTSEDRAKIGSACLYSRWLSVDKPPELFAPQTGPDSGVQLDDLAADAAESTVNRSKPRRVTSAIASTTGTGYHRGSQPVPPRCLRHAVSPQTRARPPRAPARLHRRRPPLAGLDADTLVPALAEAARNQRTRSGITRQHVQGAATAASVVEPELVIRVRPLRATREERRHTCRSPLRADLRSRLARSTGG
jgi:hypothetical protein